MTLTSDGPTRQVTDPIALELLRSRLEAVAEDAAMTIEHTGVSPTATETHDLSATLLDADGKLVAGGGWVSYHWVAATHAVRATIDRYGDLIEAGDVFLANDPYNGGGLHPNDVFVQRPIFVNGRRVAWIAMSAHLADMGGMAMGSFAPTATECFQEAFRVPPVRLFRSGEELTDVWDLLRTNVRMSMVVEIDLRALVAGSHVAQEKVTELVHSVGMDAFLDGMTALQDLSERELRNRIEAMADGTYRIVGWVDWDEELYLRPVHAHHRRRPHDVRLHRRLSLRRHISSNSQPYIIKSAMVMQFARVVAPDLPYTEGLLVPIELRCPEGTIVNAKPPAPMNAGHMHVGALAAEMMLQAVRLALWASAPGAACRPVRARLERRGAAEPGHVVGDGLRRASDRLGHGRWRVVRWQRLPGTRRNRPRRRPGWHDAITFVGRRGGARVLVPTPHCGAPCPTRGERGR